MVTQKPCRLSNPHRVLRPIRMGKSKLMIEYMLEDLAEKSDSHWQLISLRYFNPIGAYHTGTIGENPKWHSKQFDAVC